MASNQDNFTCRICGSSKATVNASVQIHSVACPRCGHFSIARPAADDWVIIRGQLDDRQIANVSGYIRERYQGSLLVNEDITPFPTLSAPTVGERADKILIELARRSKTIGETFTLNFNSGQADDWLGVSWSVNATELTFLFRAYLICEKQFLADYHSTNPIIGEIRNCYITPSGYAYLASIKRINPHSEIGFCAMWFEPRIGALWENGIRPAILDAGYNPQRIDRHEHNNKIDDEIVAMIRKSKFVIADYTGNRGGVYYEAGFAKGLGLEVIWTCRAKRLHRIHFDTRQFNFIEWQSDDLPGFRLRLRNRIEATLGKGSYSPVP